MSADQGEAAEQANPPAAAAAGVAPPGAALPAEMAVPVEPGWLP